MFVERRWKEGKHYELNGINHSSYFISVNFVVNIILICYCDYKNIWYL
jgi:hypothetical protein